ncbi:MAG: MCE family protein [Spirochaetaceae bacterium]|nr:MAG: MCE family protein [Spirochaetaceae bacterium]
MKFKIRFARQIVGVFVILGFGLLLMIIFMIGSNQRWFARNYEYFSEFQSASGISQGMSITFRGFQIGTVTNIELTEHNVVAVRFHIFDTYIDKVTENSVMQLVSHPLGFGGGLVLHQGRRRTDPLPEGSLIPSINSGLGRSLVAQDLVALPEEPDQIEELLSLLDPILRNIDSVTQEAEQLLAEVNAVLAGSSQGPLAETVAAVNAVLLELEVAVADIGKIAGNIEATTAEMRDPTGLVPRLLGAEGSIARILDDDEELYREIEKILASVQAALEDVQQMTEYLVSTTPQISGILEESRQAIDTGQEVLMGVRNNPLIRGGIPERLEQPTTFQGFRDEEF